MKNTVRLALCQVESAIAESDEQDPRPANMSKAREFVAKAADVGADLAMFGEAFLTGYCSDEFINRYACSLDPPDEYAEGIREMAATSGLHILIGLAARGGHVPGAVYNAAALFGPEGLIGVYRKVYVANFVWAKGVANESTYYARGRELPVFETQLGTIGVEICADVRHSEILRVYALKGAHVVVNIAAAAQGFEEYWDLAMRLGAMDNGLYFVMTSVVGRQKDFVFFGGSRVLDPYGQEIVRIPHGVQDMALVELDLSVVNEARGASHVFSERMPELYEILAQPSPYP